MSGEDDDLALLSGEAVQRARGALRDLHRDAAGTQLGFRAPGPRCRAQTAERVQGGHEEGLGVVDPSLPAQPFPVVHLTLTGKLDAPVGFGTGSTVDIWRLDDPLAGEGTLIGSATVAADGTFSYTDRPRAKGDVQYTVQYGGDARHAYAYGSVTVNITSD
ncbi:hypothetical protein [Streptomyces mirabilis]|uniref:hypothetical protein n=1 Tax=Streptomyces mirabilis TaxID=68239 RepID=UPI0036ACEDE4